MLLIHFSPLSIHEKAIYPQKASMHPETPCECFISMTHTTSIAIFLYATKVEAVALSYLQVGGRAPTVL
jgi:hypothetical protein